MKIMKKESKWNRDSSFLGKGRQNIMLQEY